MDTTASTVAPADGAAPVVAAATPVVDNTIVIVFNGKDVKVTPIQPGVVQRTKSIYYVQDSITKEWLYCFPERLAKLLKKYNGDLTSYTGRNSSKVIRDAEKATKKIEQAAKAEARAKETAEAAQKIKDEAARLAAAAKPADPAAAPAVAPEAAAPAEVAPAAQTTVGFDTTNDDLAELAKKEEEEAKLAKKTTAKRK